MEHCTLPKTALPIKNSKDYVDTDGSIYTLITNYKGQPSSRPDKWAKKSLRKNNAQGYLYCGIYDLTAQKCIARRIDRVVAETFIPNPQNLPIVGHKNNIKTDNRVENLYWTTWQENTQKAVDDKLLVNDKGEDDSQSKPVCWFDSRTNKYLGRFGSIHEAVKSTGIPQSTVSRQARYHRPTRRDTYFRFADDESADMNQLVGMFDYQSDRLKRTFSSIADVAKCTGCNPKTISQQCQKGKPKRQFSQHYFAYVTSSKCESTIERR